ncbi:carbohydrate-binding domain-containing protein [Neorhodopirellula lusitana]|uniref:carbohydrate-binding domain-containing protein n=1 Tax=Neorhodopirellula lusitana TaxID=445327 RepID=UPI00384F18D9
MSLLNFRSSRSRKSRSRSSQVSSANRHRWDCQGQWECQGLEPRVLLAGDVGAELGVVIDLRGQSGQEKVEVFAGDHYLGTRFLSTDWQRFDFNVQDAGLEGKDIRVNFINDLYQPELNLDRNVFVGTLFLNGEAIDPNTESAFSTSTWLAEDGIMAGAGRGSVLHANGYLQFGLPTGSRLTVYARGDEGGEQFTVQAGTEDFSPTTVSTDLQAYEFFLNETIVASSLRLRFDNDRYQPTEGIDFNLFVDRVVLDGVTYQAEAADVLQSGVVQSGVLKTGFLGSETLHANGYFQFDATTILGPRYAFDESVSGDGVMELEGGNFAFAASRSDGTFIGVSQSFGFGFPQSADSADVNVYDSNGNPDTSFSGDGSLALLPLVENVLEESLQLTSLRATELLIDSQDRTVIALSLFGTDGEDGFFSKVWAIRLTRAGDLDASFGDAGIFRFDGDLPERLSHFHVDALDRLVATDGSHLVRLTSNGQVDTSFGVDGVQMFSSPSIDTQTSQITTRQDRSIVVLLSRPNPRADNNGYLLQFNEDGSVGTWFGESGVATLPRIGFSLGFDFSENYSDVVLDSQGRATLTGSRSVMRLTENGQLDAMFGDRGLAKLPNDIISDGHWFRYATESGAVIDAEGRTVVATVDGFIRLDVAGRLDTSFSQDGYGVAMNVGTLTTFDTSKLQIDSQGRLFSPIRSVGNPAIAVWELV